MSACAINTEGTGAYAEGDRFDSSFESDSMVPDSSGDARLDASIDAATDLPQDTKADTPADVTDSSVDTQPDTAVDTQGDTVIDTVVDTGTDTQPDVPIDVKPDPVCNNGVRETGEDCDKLDFGGGTCKSLAGLDEGQLLCLTSCKVSVDQCHSCGNLIRESSEKCDGTDLGGASCKSEGWAIGTLSCGNGCTLDNAACLKYPTDWADPAWLHRRQITIDGSKVAADLTNFAVLLVIKPVDVPKGLLASGADLFFTLADGKTKLSFEIESLDSTVGLVAWVNVPSLPKTSDTKLFMYYGNAAAQSLQSPKTVWNSGFAGVWHLKEATVDGEQTGVHWDATGSHDGLQMGNSRSAGRIGYGQRFSGTDRIRMNSSTTIVLGNADFTISLWFRTDSKTKQCIFSKSAATHEDGDKLMGIGYSGDKVGVDQGWVTNLDGTSDVIDGKWHQYVWVQIKDADNQLERWILYVDGKQESQKTAQTKPDLDSHVVRLGAGIPSSYFDKTFTGELDELHVSAVPRPAGWISTEYANQAAPETFAKLGPEQSAAH